MTICVYPNPREIEGEPLEVYESAGQTLHNWLEGKVPAYTDDHDAWCGSWTAWHCGRQIPSDQFDQVWLDGRNVIELRPAPRGADPLSWGYAVIAAVVAIGVSFALRPSLPSQGAGTGSGSRLLQPDAKANQVKLGDVIPEIAGRRRHYPDYLNAPRRRFIGPRSQALHLLLCLGKGEYAIDPAQIRIGETPITSLPGVTDFQLFGPGEDVSGRIEHENWYNAPEVGASNGSAGITLKRLENQTYRGGVTASSDVIAFSVPETWTDSMAVIIDLWRSITVQDGGMQETEVVTQVTYEDGTTETVVGSFEIVRDEETDEIIDIIGYGADVIQGGGTVTETEIQQTPLPDILIGDWTGLAVGMQIRFKRAPGLEGDYIVASIDGNNMTLNTLGGAPVTDLPPGTHTTAVDRAGVYYGINAMAADRSSITVSRLLPDGSVDSGWSAFPVFNGSATIIVTDDTAGGVWAGPFRACPQRELVQFVEYDLFFPQGIAHVDEGGPGVHTVQIEVQWRDADAAGEWTTVVHTLTNDTIDQLGYTFNLDLPYPMVPEVRLRKTRGGTEDGQRDETNWYGMRSQLDTVASYPGATVLALTIEGTEGIASQSENQISVVQTRKLPVRDTVNGGWTEPLETRDIAPWFAYIAKSVGYTDDDIDMAEFDRLDNIWWSRQDWYDDIIDDDGTVKDAMNRVLRAGFAEIAIDNNKLRPVRDEPRTQPEHMYSPQNMLEPLQRDVQMHVPRDEPDGIDVEYIDGETWTKEIVECRLPGDEGIRAEKVRIDGVTDRTRAWRIGMRERRIQRYRRKMFSWSTELDALNSHYMSYDVVADDIPGYGQSCILEDIADEGGGSYRLAVSEPLEWESGATHVVGWRRPDGTLAGPFPAAQGADDYEVVAVAGGETMPVISYDYEPPHVLFGTAERWSYPVLITSISPNGFESVSVEATGYDERVYADDDNAPS